MAVSLLSAGLASGGTYAAVRAADDQGASAATSSSAAQQSPSGATTSGAQEIRQVNANAPDWTATAAAATPSVVAIRVEVQGGGAQGSGVVIDEQGHILTNNHVVDGAVQGGLKVSLSDGRTYAATIAGTDPSTDLAVVTITNPPSDLKPIAMGDSAALKVGDPVMAVGNPLGLASTVTTGIVSALNRPVTTGDEQSQFGSSQSEPVYTNAVQTSAAINPGNSGGALVDANGRLVGINSSIASTGSSGGNIGIGFAIPVNEAKVIADQLISTGSAQHAYLGVKLQDGEGKDGTATRSGALIASVSPNTPAANAGLQQGDIVIGIKGVGVESMDSLIAHIRAEKVGSTVPLTVLRNGSTTELSVTLAARPQS
ncbi:MAG: trypsin-like peptidase domain-containing protein [Actinobacteria bacterium]|nr:trypsin-like peptidase domain-containing protein [Actinomycetota bacterium]